MCGGSALRITLATALPLLLLFQGAIGAFLTQPGTGSQGEGRWALTEGVEWILGSTSGSAHTVVGVQPTPVRVPHPPIFIDGDADFTSENGVIGGNGTPADPYTIGGWIIDASNAHGVEIRNTNRPAVIRNVEIAGTGFSWYGVYLSNTANITVADSDITTAQSGVFSFQSRLVTVQTNNISSASTDGIALSSTSDSMVISNNLTGNDMGIAILGTNITVARNVLSANFAGIWLDTASNVSILENTIADSWDGINVLWSHHVLVEGNEVVRTTQTGIGVPMSSNVTVIGNSVSASGIYGIGVAGADIIVADNFVAENAAGISLESSVRVRVSRNDIVNNTVQALDDRGPQNAWNASYPEGGNFWSDYAGVDECSGANQEGCPDPDGIGDTPYAIDSDSQDRYPRMDPVANRPPMAGFTISPSIGRTSTVFLVDASASWDREDSPPGLSVRWDWEGDGTWDTDWSTAKTAQHQYAIQGIVYTIVLGVVDSGGLTNRAERRVTVDDLAPTTSAVLEGAPGQAGWNRSDVLVTLAAADGLSGVDTTVYRIDGSLWLDYSAPFSISGDGVHTLDFHSTDRAGNVETTQRLLVAIDVVAPATGIAIDGADGTGEWYRSNLTVTLTGMDATSGLALTQYRVDGGTWENYSAPFQVGEGVHVLEFWSVDAAGNFELPHSASLRIDATPPSLQISSLTGIITTPTVTVQWSGSDAVSGISHFETSVDGGPFQSVGRVTAVSLAMADGTHDIRVRAVDAAGNAIEREVPFRVDTNVFSPSGPCAGIPTYALIAGAATTVAYLTWRRRKGRVRGPPGNP